MVIERTYRARPEELWELWTTKEGFESWWGPEGFRVEVHTLEARVGGTLHYDMIADAPEQIEAMKQMGQADFPRDARHVRRDQAARAAGDHARDRLPAGGEALREHDGGGVLPVGRERAHGGHARSDARRRIHQDATMGFTSQLTKLDKRFAAPRG